ncbi:MAG TPA: histidine kinase dimerization/phospho-acceptor domain-containing protein, partial [Bryobacteraceae bacterium]|nr:histidine kinase dimerization/phospho-acceptor domain-containing protein [Bryobacteraceae bacterium]
MVKGGRRRAKAFFVILGVCMVAVAIALNIGWIMLNWRTGLLLVAGVVLFGLIISGVVLNTIFLIREIRRNEQHDAFLNAVTHELKTPVASLKLYLQTLQSRDVPEERKREFYGIMLGDAERLTSTIEQVLRAARTSSAKPLLQTSVDLAGLAGECVTEARTRHHLPSEAVVLQPSSPSRTLVTG